LQYFQDLNMFKMMAAGLLAVSFAFAPVALAAEAAPAATGVQTAAAAPAEEKEICRKVEVTGSRLGSKKICKTKAQWQAIDNRSESEVRDLDQKSRIQPIPQGS
jgi:hypothetical protein